MTKKYPTLYARTSTGAVQIWYMEQEGSSYRSSSGQENGKITVSAITEAQAKNIGKKNQKTPEEQATLEIESKYKKQLKSGGYNENRDDIDRPKFFQVTLAKEYAEYKHKVDFSKGVIVQIKFNGGRLYAVKQGLFTRTGEKYSSIPHIEEALKPFFQEFPDAILDGEAFNYELREKLNEIMKLLRKSVHATEEDIKKSKELIKFYVYDGFGFGASKEDGYMKRKSEIDKIVKYGKHKYGLAGIVEHVQDFMVYSVEELEKVYNFFLADKQEGAILRILGEPYEEKRSKNLLKYKPVDDAEFKAISIQEGEGKFADRVATITCERIDGGVYEDGTNVFNATFKGTKEEAEHLFKNQHLVLDKVVTIYYNGLTGKGKPNYARLDINNYQKT